jgi:hypothetical protein
MQIQTSSSQSERKRERVRVRERRNLYPWEKLFLISFCSYIRKNREICKREESNWNWRNKHFYRIAIGNKKLPNLNTRYSLSRSLAHFFLLFPISLAVSQFDFTFFFLIFVCICSPLDFRRIWRGLHEARNVHNFKVEKDVECCEK